MDLNFKDKKVTYTIVALVVGFGIGWYSGGVHFSGNNPVSSDTNIVSKEQLAPFWKAWEILDEKFVTSASTTPEQKIWGSIRGLASSYGDPYTVFFPPQESKIFKEDISGGFEGVGMEIGIKDGRLTVVTPLKGSPAEQAGVKAGDYILKINATSTEDLSVDRAVSFIRGKKGTKVSITFLTPGATKPVVIDIIRDVITIPTLDTYKKPGNVFVIRLYSFSAVSPDLFRNALREFVASGYHKIILDLRGNPGGYLEASWDMASWFLPVGKVIVTEDFGGNESPKVYRSKGYDVFNKSLRMLILVDGGSASASEILAGALNEQGVAKLVGQKTFGKGSVQELVSVTPETSLKVTIARWLTPQGHNLSHEGLTPDYVVKVSEDASKKGSDPIMDKALELLSKEI